MTLRPRDPGISPLVMENHFVLRRGFEEGMKLYPGISLPYDRYAARVITLARQRLVKAKLKAVEKSVRRILSCAVLPDLYLATACEESLQGAWERLTVSFVPRLRAVAWKRGVRGGEAEELAAEIPGEMLASPGRTGVRTRIGAYDGSGSLFSFLAVILIRRIVDRSRMRKPVPAPIETRPDPSAGPGETASARETGQRMEEALRQGWDSLTPREGLTLLYRFRDGLRQNVVARLIGVGPPRVSRLVQSGVKKLRTALEASFAEKPPDTEEVLRDTVQRFLQGRPNETSGNEKNDG